MNSGLEIRWHGRGGQGAKTAALLLADAAFKTGQYVQGFPEYGPERMGAPITAYNRIGRADSRAFQYLYAKSGDGCGRDITAFCERNRRA